MTETHENHSNQRETKSVSLKKRASPPMSTTKFHLFFQILKWVEGRLTILKKLRRLLWRRSTLTASGITEINKVKEGEVEDEVLEEKTKYTYNKWEFWDLV